MKKILSLLTVSVLGTTSITNVTAFSQAKRTYQNINSGSSTRTVMNLTIQLNDSGWNHLMAYKSHFNLVNKWGFGAYLFQYADNNQFHHSFGQEYMPNVPTAVKFQKNNIVEKLFVDFGGWANQNSYIAGMLTSNSGWGQDLTNWYNTTSLKNLKITTAIQFSFKLLWSSPTYGVAERSFKILP